MGLYLFVLLNVLSSIVLSLVANDYFSLRMLNSDTAAWLLVHILDFSSSAIGKISFPLKLFLAQYW